LEDHQELERLEAFLAAFAPAIVKVKKLLLALNNVMKHSEFHSLFPFLMSQLWKIFDPVMQVLNLAFRKCTKTFAAGEAVTFHRLQVYQEGTLWHERRSTELSDLFTRHQRNFTIS